MKKILRLISLMLVIAIAMTVISACGTSSKDATSSDTKTSESTGSSSNETKEEEISGEISMFMWQPDAPQIPENWANTFMEKYPKIKIDLQMMTGSGLIENLQPRIAANNLPDVISTNVSELITDLADKGMLADIGDTKAWDEQIDAMKNAWTSPTGVRFGISGGIASSLIYYNKDLFDKAGIKELPKNWDELLDVCETLKKAGITPFAWFGGFPNLLSHGPLSWGMAQEIISQIPDYPTMSKKEKYDYAGWDKIYEKMVILGERGYFQENFLGTDMNQGQQIFLEGEAAMIMHGTWISAMFLDAEGMNVGCMIPPWNEPGKEVVAVLGSESGWSVAANDNVKLSKMLLDHMCYDHFEFFQHPRKGIPPFKNTDKYLLDDRMKEYVNELSKAKISVGLASHVMPPPVFAEAMKLCQEIYIGKTPAEVPEILAKIQAEYIDQKNKQ